MTENGKNNGFTHSELMTGYDPQLAHAQHAQRAGEVAADYHREKLLGKRLPTGVKPLKKLNARHQRIIALHLTGKYSGVEIGYMLGCSAFTVHRAINDPLAQRVIKDFHSSVEMDLKALLPLAVDAIRRGLGDDDADIRLRAVDRFERMSGRAAEDERRGVNVNVSFINNVREKFVEELREIGGSTIEGAAERGSSLTATPTHDELPAPTPAGGG